MDAGELQWEHPLYSDVAVTRTIHKGETMAKRREDREKGWPRGAKIAARAMQRREKAAHGDFVAVMKDVVAAGSASVRGVQTANQKAMEALVRREAAREGIDLDKWLFNADTMRWQERTAPPTTEER